MHSLAEGDASNPIWLKFGLNGKRVYRNLETTDADIARVRQAEIMVNAPGRSNDRAAYLENLVRAGEQARRELRSLEASGLAIGSGWDAYMASRRRRNPSERTLKEYSIRWGQFAEWAKGKASTIDQVTAKVAESYTRHLESPHKSAGKVRDLAGDTVNTHLMCLRMIWAVISPDDPNPWAGIRSIKPTKITPYRRLSHPEVKRLHDAAKGDYRLLVVLGYTTGLRLIDCCLLDWSNVDLKAGFLSVTPHKTANRKRRSETRGMVKPPILPDLKALLVRKKKRKGPVMPVVAADYGKEKTGKLLARIFTAAKVEDSEKGKASFHSLRVTWMSLNDDSGTSRVISRAILGHTGAAMSDIYSQMDDKIASDAVKGAIPRLK